MKERLTAREIAAEELPDLPATERGIQLLAERQGWIAHPHAGAGGGFEYDLRSWPTLAQLTYKQKHMAVEQPAVAPRMAADSSMSAQARRERDARIAIVAAYHRFTADLRLGRATHLQVFTDKYNAGSITVDAWVREIVPEFSKRTLTRWLSAKREGKADRLGFDRGSSRKGTGVLDTANDGRVRTFILGMIAHQPHLSADDVLTACRDEFGDTLTVVSKGVEKAVQMPALRTFQNALKHLKERHKVELLKLTNPDQYRSVYAPSGVGMLRHVTKPNQLWQIDASPMDALCTDGRHSIYLCIDIATRREIIFVSRTPRASAVALLIRKAILAWGAPEKVKTDNGSDFRANDTERLFAYLGIEVELSDPYQPQQKGHVERAIGTFQHKVGPLLPGFIGHNVTDRKAIESRKAFAERLGETDAKAFAVELSGAELQGWIDEWVEKVQQHTQHAGLDGRTPFAVALASGYTPRRVDERALDVLLMPVVGDDGYRTVTKFGIRIDYQHYMAPSLLPGTRVLVRQDPNDLGRAYAFSQDGGEFLCEATCPELRGLTAADVAAAKQEARDEINERIKPIRAEMQRIEKGDKLFTRIVRQKAKDLAPNVIPLPKREETHSTAQIEAAIQAMAERINPSRPLTPAEEAERQSMLADEQAEDEARVQASVEAKQAARAAEIEAARVAHLPKDEKIVALPETPKQRYRRAVDLKERLDAGEPVEPLDAMWLGGYQRSAEFHAHQKMHEDFGEDWLRS